MKLEKPKKLLTGLFVTTVLALLIIITTGTTIARDRKFTYGDRVKVNINGRWRICTIVGIEPENVKIHFEDDETLYDRWVPINSVENFTYKIGEIILAEREGQWRAAKILAAGTLKYKVTFIGLESKFDDWLGPERIKDIQFKKGETVLAFWNNDWFRAKIMRYEQGRYFIHYEGFPESYNEWVTVDKIKKIPNQ